jgi:hypothetical protein
VIAGSTQQQDPLRLASFACPDLASINDEIALIKNCSRSNRSEIGTGAGLTEALAPSHGTIEHAGEMHFALIGCSKFGDCVGEMGNRWRWWEPAFSKFFGNDRIARDREPCTTGIGGH